MFKVKRKKDNKIIQVLNVCADDLGNSYFFLWENDGWRWRLANNYVPPNYDFDKENGGLE